MPRTILRKSNRIILGCITVIKRFLQPDQIVFHFAVSSLPRGKKAAFGAETKAGVRVARHNVCRNGKAQCIGSKHDGSAGKDLISLVEPAPVSIPVNPGIEKSIYGCCDSNGDEISRFELTR